ncbi:MAG TPA: phosphatase PAP2 family protein [Acidimicrobiales bacterium]|nr:phosphatase PAP2 family protein [Acidimicrobiales bacterium]
MSVTLPGRVLRRLDPEGRYGLRLTLLAVALLLVAVPFGLLLDQVVRDGPLVRVDTSAANELHGWVRHSNVAVRVLQTVSFVGSPPWLTVMIVGAVAYVLRRRRLRLGLFLVVTTVTGGLIDTAVKVIVDRDRPSLVAPVATAHGQSFPSGHAMSSTIAYGALLLVLLPALPARARRPVVGGGAVLVLAIGFSRLALGVHYISDVLGGYALGLAWLAASTAAFSVWRVERGRPPVEPLEGLEPEAAADLGP